MKPQYRMSFLHTASAHVPAFDRMVEEAAPGTPVRHVVAQDILEDVLAAGGIDAAIRRRIEAAVLAAADNSDVVICTCSTIAEAVEEAGASTGIHVARIDLALAEAAVNAGRRIMVVMTAASTAASTRSLFERTAARAGRRVELRFEMLEGVLDLFFAGRIDDYGKAIADAVRSRRRDCDAIVLAQVSMAAACPHLDDVGIPILVSGRSGVEHALALASVARPVIAG